IPIPGPGGRPRGILAALGERPMPPVRELDALFGVFAERAAAELDRTRGDAELRRSEELFRQIVTSCAEGVAVIDPAGRVAYCNAQAARLFGHQAPAALAGAEVLSLVVPEEREAVAAHLAARRRGVAAQYEVRGLRPDGAELRLALSAAPLPGPGGGSGGAIVIATDVTERRALDEQVREAQKRESLGVLAGGVAHEFNNLLVGILANAGVAAAERPPGSDARAALDDVRAAARKASDLTRQLLAYSGRGRFAVGPVDLTALAREMLALADPALRRRGRLVPALAAALPEVEGDAGQLGQVLMSLLTNAADAMEARPGTITVRTGVARLERMALAHFNGGESLAPGDYVMLSVEDDGEGMDDLTRARAFEPFFSTRFAGRGLGLPAAYGILKAHGGAIRIESEPGRGSVVTVLLPPRQGGAPRPAPAPEGAAPRAAAAAARPVVLVADDEDVVRRASRRALERAGFDVLEAADGRQAVERFVAEEARVGCVLLDLTMPGMGGEAALAALRERGAAVPVVLTSGFSERDDPSAEASDPHVGFLPKPFGPAELVAAVRRALGADQA
ncbi:MAG TPA: response regulator, partial [Anaeromyxobacteraceae bacterium]|nr:response regulator [Anaeromyxobacteraceae bacterium]